MADPWGQFPAVQPTQPAGDWDQFPAVGAAPQGGELVQEPGTGKWFRIGARGEWTPAEGPDRFRLAGLYAQNARDSIAGVAGTPVDLVNLGLSGIGLGSEKPVLGSAWNRAMLDKLVPGGRMAPAKTVMEKVAAGTGAGLGGVIGTMLPAGAIAEGVGNFGPITRSVAAEMTRGPGSQMFGGIVGGTVGEVTGNPYLGIGAGVTAGLGSEGVRRGTAAILGRTGQQSALPGSIPPAFSGSTPTRAEQAAAGMINKTLARDGVTDASDDLARLGPEGMLADIGGRNMRGKVRMVANAPGEGANIAEQALTARKAGEGSRIEKLMTDIFGKRVQAGQTVDDLVAQRGRDARPLYEKAFAAGTASDDPIANEMAEIVRSSQGMEPVRYGFTSPRVREFLADPITKQGIRRGLEVQRLESLAEGRPFNPRDFAISGIDNAGDPILSGVPNMRLLDAAKRGLDDILEGYRDTTTGKLALDQRGRAIDAVRKSLLKTLDDLNPDYAAAREAWSGPSQAMGAVARGRSVLRSGIDPYELAKQYGGMSASEKEMFRLGVADSIRKGAADNTQGSPAMRLFGNPKAVLNNQAERLKIIFGDDFGKIRTLAENEATFNRTLSTLSGSMTKPLADESSDLFGQLQAGVRAARGSPTGIIEFLGRLNRGVNARMAIGPEEVQAAAAKMLFAGTPEQKADAMRLLSAVAAMRNQRPPTGGRLPTAMLPYAQDLVPQP